MTPGVVRESTVRCKTGLTVASGSGEMYVVGQTGLDNGNSGR